MPSKSFPTYHSRFSRSGIHLSDSIWFITGGDYSSEFKCTCFRNNSSAKQVPLLKITGTCLWYVTNLSLYSNFFKNQYITNHWAHTCTTARVSPMASHESCLLIKSSQYTWCTCHKRASATCKLSGHQMESVVGNCCWNISLSICSPRCALTTVHQSFLCLWDCITEPREEFF